MSSADTKAGSGQEAEFPLLAKCQGAYLVAADDEAVQRDIARAPIGNDQLAQLAFDSPTDQGVGAEVVDRRLDRRGSVQRRRRVLVAQELERALEIQITVMPQRREGRDGFQKIRAGHRRIAFP